MALTIKEQLDILNGVEAPTNYTFKQYIEQVSINACQDFFDNTKTVDKETHPNAERYVQRLRSICMQISTNQNLYTEQMAKMLIAIYADTGNIAQVQAASDDGWVTFISANILSAIEKLAGVITIEKTEYSSL